MKTTLHITACCLLLLTIFPCYSQVMKEQPLWPEGILDNPVQYPAEKVRTSNVMASSLSQQNRVFSCVSQPSFVIVKPEKPSGVGIVICPGGGFRDVWFDREGIDLALYLAKYGITSMVLKYRTFNDKDITTSLIFNDYAYLVYADAKQAIYRMRKMATELSLDTMRIGIGGFSAGGSLAIGTLIEMGDDRLPGYASHLRNDALPSFACLIYPGIHPDFLTVLETRTKIPPVFMINGNEDNVTPVPRFIELFTLLQKKNTPVEMHVYAKGSHGFDSGLERGKGISGWRDSFVAWLRDMNLLRE
jgi:acetyl esterase/lipase